MTDARRWPDLGGPLALAAADPRRAREQVVGLAGGLAAASLPEFFEHACRAFAAEGHIEPAAFCYERARRIEEAHERLLGLVPDLRRVQRVLVELVPTGVITPAALHEHLRRLSMHAADRAAAHAWGREAVGAFFDTGVIPYPNVIAELLPPAAAAGVAKEDEEEFLAERLLRAGLLPGASLPVWEAIGAALARACRRAPELLDLVIAARPADGVYDDAGLAGEVRLRWLTLLADVGAGARLPRGWFADAGPVPSAVLLRLAGQAGERLFPPPGEWFDPATDPALAPPGPDPLAFRKQPKSWRDDDTPRWHGDDDFAALAESQARDPEARARFGRDLDAYVRKLNHYSNVDYAAVLRDLHAQPALREVLDERIAEWKAECAAGDLLGLEVALPRLMPLAETGYAELDPGALHGLELTDPVEAALHALRSGIPEELRFPVLTVNGGSAAAVTVVQHREWLTLGIGGETAEVHGPAGMVRREDVHHPPGARPWYEGEALYLSRAADGRRQTFRAAGPRELVFDPDARDRWPEGAAAAQVTFPGGTTPVQVTLYGGMIRLMARDGRVTARLPFAAQQTAPAGTHAVLPPPGWWPRCAPADPEGSAALRRLGRDDVVGLVDAALRGPKAAAGELARVLPEITEPRLKAGVEALLARAADRLLQVLRLRDALGLDRPAALPASVRSGTDLSPGREIERVVAVRSLSATLRKAAASGPAFDAAHPLGTIELPRGTGGVWFAFGELGGRALAAAWPWTSDGERARLLDTLRAWADTPWGDDPGHWRKLSYTSQAGSQQPEGRLWRTPNGALAVLYYQDHPHKEAIAVEHSPGGEFRPFTLPGWALRAAPTPQNWCGADRITRFDRLLAERGPAPYDVAAAHEIAERTGLSLAEVASACYGYPFFVGRDGDLHRIPEDVLALFNDPATGERIAKKTPLSYRLDRELREHLMPADPEDLWTDGLAVDQAVGWWNTEGRATEDA